MESNRLAVDDNAQIVGDASIATRRLLNSLLDSRKDNLALHAIFAFDVVNHRQQLVIRHFYSPFCQKSKQSLRRPYDLRKENR